MFAKLMEVVKIKGAFMKFCDPLLFENQESRLSTSVWGAWIKSKNASILLREKCPYSEFFWSIFSRIWTEHAEIRSISARYEISPQSVQIRENTDQKNSEYKHFLRSV